MNGELSALYEKERRRLAELLEGGDAGGEYASPVFGEGPLSPGLMLIGEAPGGEEAEAGRPFVGRAGKQLDGLLSAANITRSAVFVTNAVKFRPISTGRRGPVNRAPSKEEICAALPLLARELETVKPLCVATLGNVPLWAVCDILGIEKTTVGKAHGRPVEVLPGGRRAIVYPLYHPAAAIYSRKLLPTLYEDMERLSHLLDGKREEDDR